MANQPIGIGPVGERVAENVATFRRSLQLDQKGLSDLLDERGRPMQPSVISKIEKGDRRVDVDDLVTLSLALDVTPNRLLLGDEAGTGRPLQLTPTVAAPTAESAWRWACGEYQLFPLDKPTPLADVVRFMQENRPHERGSAALLDLVLDEGIEQNEPLKAVAQAVSAALEKGVPMRVIRDLVPVLDQTRQLGK